MTDEDRRNREWIDGMFEQLGTPDHEIAEAEARRRATDLVVYLHYAYRRIEELERAVAAWQPRGKTLVVSRRLDADG